MATARKPSRQLLPLPTPWREAEGFDGEPRRRGAADGVFKSMWRRTSRCKGAHGKGEGDLCSGGGGEHRERGEFHGKEGCPTNYGQHYSTYSTYWTIHFLKMGGVNGEKKSTVASGVAGDDELHECRSMLCFSHSRAQQAPLPQGCLTSIWNAWSFAGALPSDLATTVI